MAPPGASTAKAAVQELRLNVMEFCQEERRQLLLEDGNSEDDDCEFARGEKVYECFCGSRSCRVSRTTLLALSLFCTLAVAVTIIMIILVCTLISVTGGEEADPLIAENGAIVNWLHYPIGDLTIRRFNHTHYIHG